MASVDHRGDDVAGVCVCFYVNVWLKKSVFNHACLNMSVTLFLECMGSNRGVCAHVCVLAESLWFWQGRGRLGCDGLNLDEVEERTWEPSLLFSHLFCSTEVQEVIEVLSVCV